MQENDSTRFTFRPDEEEPEPEPAPEPETVQPVPDQSLAAPDLDAQRLKRRIAALAVLLPILTALIVFFGYSSLKQRIAAIQSTGQTDVEKLSSQVDTSFSSVSQQVEQLKEENGKMQERLIKGLDTASQQVAAAVKKMQQETAAVKAVAAAAADKKMVEETSADLQKKIEAVRKEFQNTAGEIQSLDERLSRELAVFTQRIKVLETELDSLKEEAAAQAKNRVDRNEYKAALEKQQGQYREELNRLSRSIESKLQTLEKKIASSPAIQTKTPSSSMPQTPLSKTPVVPRVTTQPVFPKASPPVGNGDIVEQNIE
ncbi:MAG: hypothetical protein ACOZF0_20520 [Thermodesulfobacteriota bacterium]